MSQNSKHISFNGFTSQGPEFFNRLADNNNKEWFEAHRQEYENVLLMPFKTLAAELSGFMLQQDTHLQVDPSKVVSRIYRDTRFSRNKSPYKTNLWLVFRRFTKDWQSHPCWFFELAADWYRYGMGFYSAPKATMDTLRKELELRPELFRKAIAPFVKTGIFTVEGEQYKKPLKIDLPEDLLSWRQLKNLHITCNRKPDALLFSSHLVEEIKVGFEALSPFYSYLWELEQREGSL